MFPDTSANKFNSEAGPEAQTSRIALQYTSIETITEPAAPRFEHWFMSCWIWKNKVLSRIICFS